VTLGRAPRALAQLARGWWISEADTDIVNGMSGSPILTARGRAIGILCASSGTEHTDVAGGPNPRLVLASPGGW
jgi:hypothetical protein